MKILFVVVILAWVVVGVLGGMHAKDNRVNWEMIIFIVSFLFIPLLAKVCELL